MIKKTNFSIPNVYKEWETQRCELQELEGQKLQLQNKLLRQRRIRLLNQHTADSGKEQRDKFEHLLADMKADMKSLKERLNDELIELGTCRYSFVPLYCVRTSY